METEQTPQAKYTDPKGLKDRLGFSEANQAQMRMNKKIPFIKIGGYVRYDLEKIDNWLKQNAVEVTA